MQDKRITCTCKTQNMRPKLRPYCLRQGQITMERRKHYQTICLHIRKAEFFSPFCAILRTNQLNSTLYTVFDPMLKSVKIIIVSTIAPSERSSTCCSRIKLSTAKLFIYLYIL